jgi:cell division protein FtsB
MLEYQRKRKVRKWMYSRVTLLVLGIFTILMAKGAFGVYLKARDSKENKMTAQAELKQLTERQVALSADIAELNTIQGVEKEIRQKFNVAKEGEQIVVIIPPQETVEAEPEKEGLWAKFKSLFKDPRQ